RRRDRDRERDPFAPEPPEVEVEFPGRPERDPTRGEEVIPDADLVPDDPLAVTRGVKGLPPAPEKRFARPGTSKPAPSPAPTDTDVDTGVDTDTESPLPGAEEEHMSSGSTGTPAALSGTGAVSRGQSGLAAQHRTDITFDEYLMDMADIAIKSASYEEKVELLAETLKVLADALRDMATDLMDDHNIDAKVTTLVADLSGAAVRMKVLARRCAEQCGIAKEAAKLAAEMVARVYGEDMAAKRDAGLAHTSAAAHHD
ncbi:hypothetical protein GTY77_18520, partial [Streptomyces sp. SID8380]|nr:hypothetical protein [Streptomyces sp. SID8380]